MAQTTYEWKANICENFASAAIQQTTNEQPEQDSVPPKPASTRSMSGKKSRQALSSDGIAISAEGPGPIGDTHAADAATSQNAEPSSTQQVGRATRPQNKFRRPTLDVGLDWKTAQQEREATEVAKATKKAENERKKAEKIEHAHLRKSGLAHIAHLEEAREQRDREEDAHFDVSGTKRAYLTSSKASGTWTASAEGEPQERVPEESGSEFEDKETSSSSESSPGEDDDGGLPKLPVKKV